MSNSLQLRYCDATLNVSVHVNTQVLIGVSSVEVDNEGWEAQDYTGQMTKVHLLYNYFIQVNKN